MSNNGGVYTFSKTAASNASADNTVNWAEGQAPSTVNDSARSMMASIAKYRDDVSGVIVTTGISVAYIVATNQVFDTLAHFGGQEIAFTPHLTNGAGGVTMTVDTFANIPLRSSPGVELPAGSLIAGTPYTATYNATDNALYLHGFFGNPYNIPLASGMDYWAATAPNSAFVFPIGQAISRTTYAALFALIGTTYGVGDGSSTFNLPDKGERVSVMKVGAASRLTVAGSGINGATLGSTGGAETHTIAQNNLPNVTLGVSGATSAVSLPADTAHAPSGYSSAGYTNGGGGSIYYLGGGIAPSTGGSTGTGTFSGSSASMNGGVTQIPLVTAQPTIVCNYIMRII